ncbi:uncharacterized protein Dwil_GK16016 [Drosophila willistoni]|uniref:Uncharacterized protein n=1 Tax=Drosophila willistoni TaxID=7260 RepID=B4NQ32_DROWI|nr:thioredoxin-related transmembrane protein 1 [Drosophila willistoni]EDW86257.2 uncharacterized protein Dwil_GK16016 [Drosophila willistoni]
MGPTKALNREKVDGFRSVIEIDEQNWPLLLNDEWLVSICAKDQVDCTKMELNSHQLVASSAFSNRNVAIAIVDLAKKSGILRRLSVRKLPFVYHVIAGEFRRIDASLNIESLCRMVENGEWKSIEVVPWWRHPTSNWINFAVFAHKAAVDLWDSGVVSDYGVATWCIALMLTGVFTMIVWVLYGGWCGIMFLWIYWKRPKA